MRGGGRYVLRFAFHLLLLRDPVGPLESVVRDDWATGGDEEHALF
jgi:hypothetical protein